MHYAIELGKISLVKFFLTHRKRESLEISDIDGRTALHCAIMNKQKECFTEVLNNCYADDLNHKNSSGLNALIMCIEADMFDYVDILLDFVQNNSAGFNFELTAYDTRQTALHLLASKNQPKYIKKMVSLNANCHVTDLLGRSPFQVAVANKSVESCRILLDSKSFLYADSRDYRGNSPLIIATQKNSLDICKMILDKSHNRKQSILQKNKKGKNALHYAGSKEDIKTYFSSFLDETEENKLKIQLQICSDLHIEFLQGEKEIIIPNMTEPSAPYLCLLGDIGVIKKGEQYEKFLRQEAAKYKKVFVVAGNHEFYHTSIPYTKNFIKRVCDDVENLYFMDKTSLLVDGVRILGCTLWSFIPEKNYLEVSMGLNDFRQIKINDEGNQLLTAKEFVEMHLEDLEWLKEEVKKAKENNETVVVLTHHAPMMDTGTSDPQYFGKPSNSAFCTDLRYLMGEPVQAWAYGHTHWFQDVTVQGTRVVSNPHGYVMGTVDQFNSKKKAYNSKMVIDIY